MKEKYSQISAILRQVLLGYSATVSAAEKAIYTVNNYVKLSQSVSFLQATSKPKRRPVQSTVKKSTLSIIIRIVLFLNRSQRRSHTKTHVGVMIAMCDLSLSTGQEGCVLQNRNKKSPPSTFPGTIYSHYLWENATLAPPSDSIKTYTGRFTHL